MHSSGLRSSRSSAGPLLVMYHGLGGTDGVRPETFALQLELLGQRRRIVRLADAVAVLGRPEAAQVAAVTFDDGYCDFGEHALPALARLGLHATLFVPAGHLGGSNVWDAGRAPRREILSAAQLRALPPEHVEVGAHGLAHRRLAGLPAEALHQETAGARKELEDRVGRAVSLFAYPYGQVDDFDRAAERAVEAAGFAAACSTRFGRGSDPEERYRLRRVGIEPRDSLDVVARKLDGAYDWVAWKESVGGAWRRALAAGRPSRAV